MRQHPPMLRLIHAPWWAFAGGAIVAALLAIAGWVRPDFGFVAAGLWAGWLESSHQRRDMERYKLAQLMTPDEKERYEKDLKDAYRLEEKLTSTAGRTVAFMIIAASFIVALALMPFDYTSGGDEFDDPIYHR